MNNIVVCVAKNCPKTEYKLVNRYDVIRPFNASKILSDMLYLEQQKKETA